MKFEKKVTIFGAVVVFVSVCLLLYISFGWNDEKGVDAFPGNSVKKHSPPPVVVDNTKNTSATSEFVQVEGASIRTVSVGKTSQMPVLLLHGAAFSSKTWEDLDTLNELEKAGFHAIAVDLPGYGKSERLKTDIARELFLDKLIQTLKIKHPVIISPSFSGSYSIPFLLKYGEDKLSGYIPVAPTISSQLTEKDFKMLNVPTLIIYGEKDTGAKRSTQLLSQIPKHKIAVIPNGDHPAYLTNPKLFHKIVIDFLENLK